MVNQIQAPFDNSHYHSALLQAYAIDENTVQKKIEEILELSKLHNSTDLKYLLAKAYVFGNLVNIKWLYYCNRMTTFAADDIHATEQRLYCQNYLEGIKQYSLIVDSLESNLDESSSLNLYMAFELYQILNLPDDFRSILNLPAHSNFSKEIQIKLNDLKINVLKLLGRAGYPSILVDYNQYFLNSPNGVSPQQLLAILHNYQTVINEFGIPIHIQNKARESLFYMYLKGENGISIDEEKALSYLQDSTDYALLEAVGFDLYYGQNSLLKTDKVKAKSLLFRCFFNSEKVKVWSKVNEPDWYAEFEIRSKAIDDFFKSNK